ncbi:F-box only protein 15 [Polymixia lowei]
MANYLFLRLPSEILLKILSYLDASSLFCISYVNKLFHQLANEDALWHKMYVSEFGKSWKPKCVDEVLLKLDTLKVQDRTAGNWKRVYFRSVAGYDMNRWKRELRAVSPYTGLPVRTASTLSNSHVAWELTVSDKRGYERTFEMTGAHFFESSVAVCWNGGCFPTYHQLSTLQLHGVMRVALNCASHGTPGWRSLMAKLDSNALCDGVQVIGKDRLVKLQLVQPGIVIGTWRGQSSIAFVMVSLHFHRLVERSLLGSPICPYSEPVDKAPFDDIDPEYGLHDYTLHIVLHNAVTEIMSGHFSRLACRKVQIHSGLIQLIAINKTDLAQHTTLSGNINLPWKCECLEGTVENCCFMSMTLLDEFQHPFWCVSSPVKMVLTKKPISYDYDGEHFLIRYQDREGQVKMELVWMKEQKQFFLVSLVVSVAVYKVNKHFGREY